MLFLGFYEKSGKRELKEMERHFMKWLTLPVSEATRKEIGVYVDHLLWKRRTSKTITCHLQTIRLFFDFEMVKRNRWDLKHQLRKQGKGSLLGGVLVNPLKIF
jgi:site-specific recombinase XerD